MGKNSKIEWCHHTFNTWWGCEKVSPACKNCYADGFAKRVGWHVWGENAPRRFFGDGHWRQPLLWNEEARKAGERARVFCASMADVFEERPDLDASRERLWELISKTPFLDWLLLTKRPHAVDRAVPWTTNWPDNVWLGTTVEIRGWLRNACLPFSKSPQNGDSYRANHYLARSTSESFLSTEDCTG
jgi:protein gp37